MHVAPSPAQPFGATFESRLETLERKLGPRIYLVAVALGAFLLLQLLTCPHHHFELFAARGETGGRYGSSYLPISQHPLDAVTPDGTQFRLRILGPLIACALRLPAPYVVLPCCLASLPAFYVAASIARRHLSGPAGTAGFAALLATVHPFVIGNAWPAYQDALGGLCVLLAMRFRAAWAIAPCAFAAMLADERFALAAPAVVLWHHRLDSAEGRAGPHRAAIVRSAFAVGAAIVWLAYAALLCAHLHLTVYDLAGPAMRKFANLADHYPLNIYVSLRAAWMFPLAALAVAARRSGAANTLAWAILLVVPTLWAAAKVADVSRVAGVLFVLIPAGALLLKQLRPGWLLPLLAATLALNVLCPTLTGVQGSTFPLPSTPMYLLLRCLGLPAHD